MNAYTQAVRTNEAVTRIVQAAKEIAPQFNAIDQLVALEAVKEKDTDLETVKRLEAVAAFFERVQANLIAGVSSQVSEAKPQTVVSPAPARKGK